MDNYKESALDAIYLALNSQWRDGNVHKAIILLTDRDSHATLSKATYNMPDNTIKRVIQEFQQLQHALLYLLAPETELYRRLEQAGDRAGRQVLCQFFSESDPDYRGLAKVDWQKFMSVLGKTVSTTSIVQR